MSTPLLKSPLLSPVRLKDLVLRNRLVVAPMTRISASDDGVPTDRMISYYSRFAQGGFALVVTEGIYTDCAYAQGYLNQPGLTDIAQARGWRSIVDAVHAHGGLIFGQLMHAGGLSQGNRFRKDTVGPSAVRPKGTQMEFYRGDGQYLIPRPMQHEDFAVAIDGFARAARYAVDVAGFDGIEIHGANGYLLDQFLTSYTNLRKDQWGGSIGQRLRLILEVVRAVRREIGSASSLGVRISQGKVNDFEHKWPEREAGAAVVFSALASEGLDFVHITEFEAWKPAFDGKGPTLVELARKYAPDLKVIANGSLHEPERALAVLQSGADLVALGRGALANPDWPRRVAQGSGLRRFDQSLLKPTAEIKDFEASLLGEVNAE